MVSSCALMLDDIDLTGQKRYVPDFLSALFQEADRVETADPDGGEPEIEYRAARHSILKRLDLMGCTAALAERRYRDWREKEIADRESYIEEYEPDSKPGEDETLEALRTLTWEEWQRRIPEVLRTLYSFDNYGDEIDRRMKELG